MYLHMGKEEKTKDENKITKRSQGNRLPIGKIKTEIIIYIISQPYAVSGSEIKEYLRIKYNIRDERDIRQHFEDLLKSHCIEKIKKVGYENKWDITKIKILKNVWHDFSEIKLNKYEKSLNIVLKELGYSLDSPNASRLRSELFLSPSFFKMCLENNIEALYALSYKIYKFGEDSDESKIIIKYTNDVYNGFSKEISAKPNIWLAVYSETANDPLKSSFYQNFIKSPPDFEFSE